MNISEKRIDDVNGVITVSIEKADYAENVKTQLKEHSKKVSMPGFRPGKVPFSLVNKMYGKSVMLDEVNKLMSEHLTKYLEEADFQVLGDPLPSESQPTLDFDSQEDFEFVFDVAIAPEINIALSKREKIKFYTIKVEDSMVEKQIEAHASRFGEHIQVEEALANDMLKGSIVQLDAEGNVLEGGIQATDVVLTPEYMKVDEIKDSFIGAKVGDVISFNPKTAYDNDTEVASMLKVKKEEVENLDSEFSLTVNEITRYVNAEVNQDLFDKVYGEGAVASEDEFRTKIAEEIRAGFVNNSDYKFLLDAKDKMLKKVEDVVMPEEFLKRWLIITNKDNEKLTEAQIEAEFPKFIEDLKWNIIKGHLSKVNDVKVEEADTVAFAKDVARSQFAQYGMTNVPDEHLENYAKELLNNQEQGRGIIERVLENKIMAVVKESVKVEEEEVTLEAFNKMVQN